MSGHSTKHKSCYGDRPADPHDGHAVRRGCARPDAGCRDLQAHQGNNRKQAAAPRRRGCTSLSSSSHTRRVGQEPPERLHDSCAGDGRAVAVVSETGQGTPGPTPPPRLLLSDGLSSARTLGSITSRCRSSRSLRRLIAGLLGGRERPVGALGACLRIQQGQGP